MAAGNDFLPHEELIVIDTLRASSTIVVALSCGVEEIIPVACDEEAFRLKEQGAVTAGESRGIQLSGYDLGNSPVEAAKKLKGLSFKTMAFKTSNMVPLLLKLPKAWICSSLNLKALALHITGKDTYIIAAGSEYGYSEDLAVAIALFSHLSHAPFDEDLISYFIQESPAAQHLRSIGYGEDVLFISRVNAFDVLPYYDGKSIKKVGP